MIDSTDTEYARFQIDMDCGLGVVNQVTMNFRSQKVTLVLLYNPAD